MSPSSVGNLRTDPIALLAHLWKYKVNIISGLVFVLDQVEENTELHECNTIDELI